MIEHAIEIRNLTKIFGQQQPSRLHHLLHGSKSRRVVALNNVTLTIERGEIFGLVGRNGQGKTTLIKSISALIEPTSGCVLVHGHDTRTGSKAVKSHIGLVSSDERTFYGRLTGWQNLLFFARLYGLESKHAHQRIQDLVDEFEFQLMMGRRFQELSTGNKQRLAIMRALLIDPPILLLDEPTRSLDPIAADELRKLIYTRLNKDQGKTILITSHNLVEVENLCSRVGFLSAGEIKLCATMDELEKKYFDRENVNLSVRGLPGVSGLLPLNGRVADLDCKMCSQGILDIRFSRSVGDESLNMVLENILAYGGKVVNCNVSRYGLREILDSIDN